MKHIKLFEEYRYFKVNPSKKNIKDINEPFFVWNKTFYKKTYDQTKSELDDAIESLNDSIHNLKIYVSVDNVTEFISNLHNSLKKLIDATVKSVDEGAWDEEQNYLQQNLSTIRGKLIGLEMEASGFIVDDLADAAQNIMKVSRMGLRGFVDKHGRG